MFLYFKHIHVFKNKKKTRRKLILIAGASLLLTVLFIISNSNSNSNSDMLNGNGNGSAVRSLLQHEKWKQRHLIVDRIEGKYAVCESLGGIVFHLNVNALPAALQEGDVIEKVDGRLQVNEMKTKIRKDMAKEKEKRIWGN